jgi:EpsI family protein
MIVIVAGHATDMQHYFVAVEHETLGWVIFGILVLAIAYLSYRYRGDGDRQPSAPPAQQQHLSWPAVVIPVVLMTLALVATPRLNAAETFDAHLGALPVLADRWQGPLPVSGEWRPHFVGPTRELRAAYDSDLGGVEIYANVYGVQVPGRELIFYANSLQANGEWSDLRLAPAVSSGGPLEEDGRISLLVSAAADGRWLVSYVYVIDGRVTGSEWLAQAFYGLRSLRGVAPSGVLAVAARCASDCEAARSLLGAFWKDQGPRFIALIGNSLPGVSG